MVATVRLDKKVENSLNNLTKELNKKKSDVIRDAINYYALMIESRKKAKIKDAVLKTKDADKKLLAEFEDILDEAL